MSLLIRDTMVLVGGSLIPCAVEKVTQKIQTDMFLLPVNQRIPHEQIDFFSKKIIAARNVAYIGGALGAISVADDLVGTSSFGGRVCNTAAVILLIFSITSLVQNIQAAERVGIPLSQFVRNPALLFRG